MASPRLRVTSLRTRAQVEVEAAKKKGAAAVRKPPYLIICRCGYAAVVADDRIVKSFG